MTQRLLALALSLLALPVLAEPPDSPGTKPVAEQNLDASGWIKVHEQGTAKVDVQNANLGVTVTNVPAVTVANVPGVTVTNTPSVLVQSIPNVTIGAMPSVTIGNPVLDVHLTNASVPVNGTVSIANFPAEQPAGPLPTVTRLFHTSVVLPAGEQTTLPISSMAVVTFELSAFDNSFAALVRGSLGEVMSISDDHENMATDPFYRTFMYPVPVGEVQLFCFNVSDDCVFGVTMTGF